VEKRAKEIEAKINKRIIITEEKKRKEADLI
jgi:hypothetical protein